MFLKCGAECPFDERQRGEILTPVENILRFARFLASLEMTGGRAVLHWGESL